jgi:competence protein ComEC
VRNDDSVVLEVIYGDVAILLTGDVGEVVEREVVSRLVPARTRILKVGHHGSRTSTSQALLDAWRPEIALISCGRGNPFGHPAPEVLSRLRASGATVYRTDQDGQITLDTDGHQVVVKTFVDPR